ncbi:WD40 repeat-like protein [Ramaria rubella]|nr:WD40 repeat-like protein [Ramaria rubella]
MASAEIVYISASTNRHPHAAHVSGSSLVSFASQKYVALWDASDPNNSGVHVALRGHKAEVNCVKFMQNENVIASGDQNGVLQIRTKRLGQWKVIVEHSAHTKPITTLATHDNLIVTGSSDATVKLWRLIAGSGNDEDSLDLVQNIDMEGRYSLDVALAAFPATSCLILAIASTGKEIKIWSGSKVQLVHSASLSGHDDWIRSLAFTQSRRSPPQLTLASGSQDGTIRLWTIDHLPTGPRALGTDILDEFEASLGAFSEGEDGGRQMSTKRHVIAIKSLDGSVHRFSLVFDALLVGHEAGITSVSWRPGPLDFPPSPTLLSTSVDSSLIIWSPSSSQRPSVDGQDSTGLWINQQRFGDVGGQRFGGFVGGLWAASGTEVLGWEWNGGWRRWRHQVATGGKSESWEEVNAITGHYGIAKSIAWAPHGDYLLSSGLDQTTRIHAPHRLQASVPYEVWHELGRPQTHGYDIIDAAFISSLRFVSIGDEKVARVFDAPKGFVALLNSLSTVREPLSLASRPAGANVPPLGLSNKATTDNSETIICLDRFPFESELASTTLWPEIEKIFGHGYELISLATSHSNSLVVTACKSTTAEHAVLRVNNTRDWQPMGQPLAGHTLTVTRIAFCPNDTMVLSVSRDRTWRLFRLNAQANGYSPLAMDRSHGRIIWDCAWMIEPSEVAFATASRDKTVKVWRPVDESLSQWAASATLKFNEAVTAIDFSPVLRDGHRRLAVGLESGDIFIYSSRPNANDWWLELTLDSQLGHGDSIYRIIWRPSQGTGPSQQLATCSEDRSIRVMMVHLDFH